MKRNESNNPDGTAPLTKRLLSYALFDCSPMREPPFNVELGCNDGTVTQLIACSHIPDALEKLEAYCQRATVSKSPAFTLLYPIYLEAMGTDEEDSMHNIAWLIKDQADKNKWSFGRIGGYTGRSTADFVL